MTVDLMIALLSKAENGERLLSVLEAINTGNDILSILDVISEQQVDDTQS
jgi:hypothetical protein